MLAFNPDEYRQKLNLALGIRDPSAIGAKPAGIAPAKIENPYDTEEPQAAPQQQPQEQQQPAPQNLAAALPQPTFGQGGAGNAPNLPGPVIDESGAMGGAGAGHGLPIGENGKIQTRPPDLEASVDPKKLDKAKTIDDVFDAAAPETQNKYMDWWEKSYGDINEKYDTMREQLGEHHELPEKMSRKQMFTMLLGYGARMMNNMRVGRQGGASDIDPMAASDDAFAYGQDVAMGNRMSKGEYDQNLGAIEAGRSSELKGLGNKGQAMDKSSEIALRDAQRENLGKTQKSGERFTDEKGLVWMISKDGTSVPVNDPKTGKQLRGAQNLGTGGSRNEALETEKYRYDEYMRIHGVGPDGKKLTGAKLREVEGAARNHARYGTMPKEDGENLDDLRAHARERINTMQRSNPDLFRGMEPEEVSQKLGELEEQEFQRLKRENLGSSPMHDGPRSAAPKRSEDFVRSRPETLEDFVADYGYVPEGMEQYVTPAIKQHMGL